MSGLGSASTVVAKEPGKTDTTGQQENRYAAENPPLDGTSEGSRDVRGHFKRSRRASDVLAERSPLESLLEEMRDLRLTLATDLTAAAGAAEEGAEGIAADIVEADRQELARFARVADQRLLRLQRLATAGPETPKWRRRVVVSLPVVPVIGAMAVSAAAATGVLPVPGGSGGNETPAVASESASSAPVDSTFREFVDGLDNNPSASQVIAAADQLHRQLRHLMKSSPNDPNRVSQIAELLRMEQSLLMRAQPPGVDVVLDATRKLAARLVTVLPNRVRPTDVPTVLPTFDATPDADRHAKTKTSPTPKPSQTTDAPKPTQSPNVEPTSPPPDDDDGGPLPHLPQN